MIHTTLTAISAALLLAACVSETQATSDVAPPRSRATEIKPSAEQAEMVFQMRCTTCHGSAGHGDGPEAVALLGGPLHDLADKQWQRLASDSHIEKVILGGNDSPITAHKQMRSGDLIDRPDVVKALVDRVRRLAL